MGKIGIGLSTAKGQIINDPSSIPDLVLWYDFTNASSLRQDRDGTGTVSANNDPVEWARNLANGDANGNVLGSFARSSTAGSSYGATFKTGGSGGQSYLQFADDASDNDKGLRSGYFSSGASILDGGVAFNKFSDVVMDMRNFTVIQVLKHDDADIDISNDFSFEMQGYANETSSDFALFYGLKDRNSPDKYKILYIGDSLSDEVETNGQLDTNPHVLFSRSKNETNGFILKIDGTTQTDTETPEALTFHFDSSSDTGAGSAAVCIGGMNSGNLGGVANSWQGGIYEIMVYNRGITDDEMADLNIYLAQKYGITIS
tara:strand:+ start:317 stop:1264 length:948 start_codon:yes stop_codon:yes gene_type:complete